MEPTKFRKKPVVIEAMQFTGEDSIRDLLNWGAPGRRNFTGTDFVVSTLEGPLTASVGDWIIRGVQGEFYPCKPEIFEATYEPVEDAE